MQKPLSEEQLRYEKHGPLRTLLQLSVGPLIYFLGIAIHDAIDLLLISKAYDEREVQIVGFASTVRYLCMAANIYFSIACVARNSGLIAENRYEAAAQVTADLYRLAFVSMLVIPIICYFIAKPLLKYIGCPDDSIPDAQKYLIPELAFMPLISTFQMSCGLLQSEGRSVLAGIMQFTAFFLNCGFFGPILLFGVKVAFKYAGFAFALSQSVPGLVLTFLIFTQKFKSITSWKNLIKKPIYETYVGLKIASPYILNVIMGLFPPLVAINFLVTAAFATGVGIPCGRALSVFFKLQPIANCFSIAFGQGLLGPGSYSFSQKNNKRVRSLFYYALTITLVLQFIFVPIIVFAPVSIAKIWLHEEDTLNYAKKLLPKPFFTNWTTACNEVVTALLQCMGYAWVCLLYTSPSPRD